MSGPEDKEDSEPKSQEIDENAWARSIVHAFFGHVATAKNFEIIFEGKATCHSFRTTPKSGLWGESRV